MALDVDTTAGAEQSYFEDCRRVLPPDGGLRQVRAGPRPLDQRERGLAGVWGDAMQGVWGAAWSPQAVSGRPARTRLVPARPGRLRILDPMTSSSAFPSPLAALAHRPRRPRRAHRRAFEPLELRSRRDRPRPRAATRGHHRARALRDRAPRRRAQRDPGPALARARAAHGASHRDARRGRPERDRPGAVRRARRAAHGRAPGAAPLRRRRAVLRPGLRVRLLLQRRGDLREVGPRGDARRHRPRRAHASVPT